MEAAVEIEFTVKTDLIGSVRRLEREPAGSGKNLGSRDPRRCRLLLGNRVLLWRLCRRRLRGRRCLLRFEFLLEYLDALLEFLDGRLFGGSRRASRRGDQ